MRPDEVSGEVNAREPAVHSATGRKGLRFLIASPYFESQEGGVELVAGRMVRSLCEIGCSAAWIATDTSTPPADPRFVSVQLPAWDPLLRRLGVPMPLPAPRAFKTVHQTVHSCDVVILHDCLYATNALIFWVAKAYRKPVIIVQHIGTVPYKSPILRGMMALGTKFLTRPMLAGADQVVFISHKTAAEFAGAQFRRAPKFVFNGVDAGLFRPAANMEEREALKAELQLPIGRAMVLFVGRFVEKKGLQVIRGLAIRRPEFDFVLVGRGPLDPRLWNLPNVHIKGSLQGENLGRVYRAADIFLLPSVGEGFPLVVQEALCAGLPVVCSADIAEADPGMAALVYTGRRVTGTLAGDTDSFEQSLMSALAENDPALRARRHVYASTVYSSLNGARKLADIASGLVRPSAGGA